jgi:hypothetical protein
MKVEYLSFASLKEGQLKVSMDGEVYQTPSSSIPPQLSGNLILLINTITISTIYSQPYKYYNLKLQVDA